MVIDSSALLSILLEEPDKDRFAHAIENDERRLMSVASFLEVFIVLERRFGADGTIKLDQLIAEANINLVPVDVDQAYAARTAFRVYGKGRHPARLNFGDCFTYALANTLVEPLLFKGNDFSKTNIAEVLN